MKKLLYIGRVYMPDKLVLHAVIFHKGYKYNTKEICLKKAREML